jgi:hypothetical protein
MDEKRIKSKSIEELEELFDLTPPPEEEEAPALNDDLTISEMEEVALYAQLRYGVMLVTGEPGAGKDTFMHFLLWKLKTLFKGYGVMLDRKPRILFGSYIPFNMDVLQDELQRSHERAMMGKAHTELDFAKYTDDSRKKKKINQAIDNWRDKNQALFANKAIGLTELWRYFYNRRPHNIMNYTMQPLLKRYRHYKSLIIGTTPHENELDIKSYLSWVTHVAVCNQTRQKGLHSITIHSGRSYLGNTVLTVASKPFTLYLDALQPKERLNGDIIYNLFNSYEQDEFSPRVKIEA